MRAGQSHSDMSTKQEVHLGEGGEGLLPAAAAAASLRP